jgi:hypothetical protein
LPEAKEAVLKAAESRLAEIRQKTILISDNVTAA